MCFLAVSLYSQSNSKIDSLLILYQKDKNNINTIRKLSREFENINTEKSIFYAQLALKKSKDRDEIIISNRDLGETYFMANKIDSAIIYLKKSVDNDFTNNEFKFRTYVSLANCFNQKREMLLVKEFIDKAAAIEGKINSNDHDFLSKKLRLHLIKSQYYQNINDFDKAFESATHALKLSKQINDKKRELRIMNTIANIYDSKGDREKAILIYKDLISKAKIGEETSSNISVWYYNLANTLMKVDKFEESLKYINKGLQILKAEPGDKMNAYFYLAKAQVNIDQKMFTKAMQNIQFAEDYFLKQNIKVRIADCNYFRSKIFIEKEDYKNAELFILKSIAVYKVNSLNQELKDCYEILVDIKAKQKNYKEAFAYYKKYNEVDDNLFSENKIKSISNAEIKFETYVKDLQIANKELELQTEKTNKYIAFGGAALLLLLTSGGYFWFRNKEKRDKLETQNALLSLQFDLNKMELQSLNKQLDPHEIKNLLSSISPEIQEKAPESYRKMLKLLNITKASLNNSSMTESVKNQVQQIEDFLSLEKNSLSVPFEYSIQNNIETKGAQIPRLMLKNLVENAIKHGIKRNENGGNVNVILTEENQFFKIIVDDTGKGRKLDTISDTGIGTSTYKNLFATLNKKNIEAATFEIIDKKQGTRVQVKIPTNYKYE